LPGFIINPAGLVLIGTLILAFFYGQAAISNLWVGVLGGDIDGYENMWNDYWTSRSILNLNNPYFTDFMYYPTGVSLRFHTLHPLTGFYALVSWPVIGPIAATNLLFVLSLALTHFFGYLLINDFVKKPLASFAGAAIFTYANDQVIGFFGAGQTEKLSAQWLPLYLFFMFRLVYRPANWKLYFPLSVFGLLLLCLTDWQYTIYAVLTTTLFFIYTLFTRRNWHEKALIFGKLAGIGLVWGGIIFFPLVLPMIDEAARSPWLSTISKQSVFHSLDVLGFIRPALTNPGYLAIAIMLLGLIWNRHLETVRFWAICGFIALLFTFGPNLIFNGVVTGIPGPYALLSDLPVLSAGRDPGRFYTLVMLAFGIIFGLGLKTLLERNFFLPLLRKTQRFTATVSILVVTAIILISLVPFVMESWKARVNPQDVPTFFEELAKDPEQYAILEIPLFTDKGRGENVYQSYQIIHNKKRFGGRYARDHKLANPDNFSKRTTFFRDVFWAGTDRLNYYRPPEGKDFLLQPDLNLVSLPLLNYYNVRYVVLWKEAMPEPGKLEAERTLVKAALGHNAVPIYQDTRMEAYRVPPGALYSDKVFLDVGEGWHVTETDGKGQFRWADPDTSSNAELYAINLTAQPVRIKLSATLFSYVPAGEKQPRHVNIDINGYLAASYPFPDYGDEKREELELTIPPGFNIINFTSPEPARPASNSTGVDNRKLSFGVRLLKMQLE
jgi:hypothetical protein